MYFKIYLFCHYLILKWGIWQILEIHKLEEFEVLLQHCHIMNLQPYIFNGFLKKIKEALYEKEVKFGAKIFEKFL